MVNGNDTHRRSGIPIPRLRDCRRAYEVLTRGPREWQTDGEPEPNQLIDDIEVTTDGRLAVRLPEGSVLGLHRNEDLADGRAAFSVFRADRPQALQRAAWTHCRRRGSSCSAMTSWRGSSGHPSGHGSGHQAMRFVRKTARCLDVLNVPPNRATRDDSLVESVSTWTHFQRAIYRTSRTFGHRAIYSANPATSTSR
jgi:hypothetical protein